MADVPQIGPDPNANGKRFNANPSVVAAGMNPLPKKVPPNVEAGGELADKLTEFLGLKVTKGRAIPGFNKLIVTWLAPQPFGFVKPQKFGLPENYLFGFTPRQVMEAIENNTLQEIHDLLRFERDREAFHQRLDVVEQQLGLKQLSTRQLVQLRTLNLPADQLGLGPSDATQAITRELSRRPTQEVIDALNFPTTTTPTIEDRNPEQPQVGVIVWPREEVTGFIDGLAALLPPDP